MRKEEGEEMGRPLTSFLLIDVGGPIEILSFLLAFLPILEKNPPFLLVVLAILCMDGDIRIPPPPPLTTDCSCG